MARPLPPLNALRAFEAAARHLSFVRAANELHVTPAAISQQVKTLEAFLEVSLFHRLPRGLTLTPEGRAYLPDLSKGFDHMMRATERLVAGGLAGRLVINALPSFALCWLTPKLGRFLAEHPDVEIAVQSESRNIDMLAEDVDVGIRYGMGRYPGLFTELVLTEDLFPIVSPTLLNGPKPLRSLGDLQHHVLIHDVDVSSGPMQLGLHWHMWLEEAGIDPETLPPGPGYSDSSAIIAATIEGQGVAIGRSALIQEDLRQGRLVRPFTVAKPAEFAYYLVCRPGAEDTPRIAAFRTWLREMVAEAGTALEPARRYLATAP